MRGKKRFYVRLANVYDSDGAIICQAKSGNAARRIAEALNQYTPSDRGK